ncbi:hypothetical protein BH10PSE7_BH10PSE7_37430 [soil metagenome]
MSVTTTYQNIISTASFQSNSFEDGLQVDADLLGLTNGGFVSLYGSEHGSGAGDLQLDFFDANHNPIAGGHQVILATGTTQASVTQLANGNVLVVYSDNVADNGEGLRGHLYTEAGQPIGSTLKLNGVSGGFDMPQVTALKDGGFVVSATIAGNILMSHFAADGSGGVMKQVNAPIPGIQEDAAVAALQDGGYVLTYTDTNPGEQTVRGIVFNEDGTVRKADFIIGDLGDNTQSSVAGLPNGYWAVAYTDTGWGGTEGSGAGITLQIFTKDGVNVTPGAYIHVNTPATVAESDPDITVLANGFVVVSWTRETSPTDKDIMGRVFDSFGNPVTIDGSSNQFFITSSIDNDVKSSIAHILDGEFGTSWQDSANDGSSGGITTQVNELVRTMTGDNGSDAFYGDSLRDIVDAGNGADTVYGGGGRDLLQGGLGADTIYGSEGNDELYAMTKADAAGSSGNDLLNGEAGNDTITGSTGNDTINGGTGNDTMAGGEGNDQFIVINGGDKVFEAAGQGSDTVFAGVTYVLQAGQSIELLATGSVAGTGAIDLTGNELAQQLYGNSGANILNGGGGADSMYGFDGNDSFVVDNAGDKVFEASGKGNDTVFAAVSFAVADNQSIELLATGSVAGTTAINLTGNNLAQQLDGNNGANILNGGGAADNMYGFDGNDSFIVDNSGDKVFEASGKGNDTVFANTSFTLADNQAIELLATGSVAGTTAINLTGNNLAQQLYGNNGANILNGGGGADSMYGFGGNDSVSGGIGNDTVSGGAGEDSFFFTTALNAQTNVDKIVDYSVAQDTIRLDDAIFTALGAPGNGGVLVAGHFHIGAAAADAGDRIIYNSNTGALLYDADGVNGSAAIKFAQLDTGLALTNADFMII